MRMIIILILLKLLSHDYHKPPIDKLYFKNPKRIYVGIRNSIIDIFFYKAKYEITEYKNLSILSERYKEIQEEFINKHEQKTKKYFHDLDEWFEKDYNYYYYDCKEFKLTKDLITEIPSIEINSAVFSVMKGPYYLPNHKAESNYYLRYQLTILNKSKNNDSWLIVGKEYHNHKEGECILFDHSRSHSVEKNSDEIRVVLIADVNRFNK